MSTDSIYTEIQAIKKLISEVNIQTKQLLNIEEAAIYLRISTSTLYKLTSSEQVVHYKPNGKTILFKRNDLDEYVARGKVEVSIRDKIDKEDRQYENEKREAIISNLLKK